MSRRPIPIAERLSAKCTPDPVTGCWLWTGARNRKGYGIVGQNRKCRAAPRVAWEVHNGPIPEGMFVCHRCDTRACINPEHLFLGTHEDNMRDMAEKGRGRNGGRRGGENNNAKLTAADVAAIRADSRLHRLIAADFGVTRQQVQKVLAGKRWAHL